MRFHVYPFLNWFKAGEVSHAYEDSLQYVWNVYIWEDSVYGAEDGGSGGLEGAI